jgi:hypothetical protein
VLSAAMVRTGDALSVDLPEVTQPRFLCYSSDMILLEKRETRKTSSRSLVDVGVQRDVILIGKASPTSGPE